MYYSITRFFQVTDSSFVMVLQMPKYCIVALEAAHFTYCSWGQKQKNFAVNIDLMSRVEVDVFLQLFVAPLENNLKKKKTNPKFPMLNCIFCGFFKDHYAVHTTFLLP